MRRVVSEEVRAFFRPELLNRFDEQVRRAKPVPAAPPLPLGPCAPLLLTCCMHPFPHAQRAQGLAGAVLVRSPARLDRSPCNSPCNSPSSLAHSNPALLPPPLCASGPFGAPRAISSPTPHAHAHRCPPDRVWQARAARGAHHRAPHAGRDGGARRGQGVRSAGARAARGPERAPNARRRGPAACCAARAAAAHSTGSTACGCH